MSRSSRQPISSSGSSPISNDTDGGQKSFSGSVEAQLIASQELGSYAALMTSSTLLSSRVVYISTDRIRVPRRAIEG